jgi:glycosyltransferase involved in cell wall biosynthesis
VIACERTYPPALQPQIPLTYRVLRKLTYPFASSLVAQTNATAEWLRRRCGRALVATIPNPVVIPLPSQPPILDPNILVGTERKIILWAGRFDEWKRGNLLIEAFARLAAEACDWDVYMLGSGPLRETLQQRVFELKLGERVFLPGFAGNLGDWYKRADIYVMTSSYEGFPNTLLEAMAHGVPSIAYDVLTGPRDLRGDQNRLILLPDTDELAGLEAALASLISNPQLRGALGFAAKEIETIYSEQAVFAMWDDLFNRVNHSSIPSKTKLRAASTK